MTFETFLDELERRLDAYIDSDDDQGLFCASYLQGHLSVVASRIDASASDACDQLVEHMRISLADAFEKGELSANDRADVEAVWYKAVTSAQS